MYKISPPAVFAHTSVMNHPRYRAGVDRVVATLEKPVAIEVYDDDQLPALIRERGWLDRRVAMGTLDAVEDPILLFNTFRFDDETETRQRLQRLEAAEIRGAGGLLGLEAFRWAHYNLDSDPERMHKVCRPCWRIHLQQGCLHRCAYCGLGGLLVCMMNVDDYCRHLRVLIDRHPWQKTYLLDDDADPPGLEPELGCLGPLIEFFGTLEQRYLIVHTKTWNTEWLRDLNHAGHTIVVWSLSGETQSRWIEPRTGTMTQRIEAARFAQQCGYPVRYKFKPIIPVRNWRRDAAAAVEMLFARTSPDVISLCCLMWMDVDEMKRRLAPAADLLDPEFLRLAETARGRIVNPLTQPFPDEARAVIYDYYLQEIRKHNPTIPVSLSTESWEMWKAFAPRLGMSARRYVCGCGPQSVPGARILEQDAFECAVRNDGGTIPCVCEL